jgi:hypothetical protein
MKKYNKANIIITTFLFAATRLTAQNVPTLKSKVFEKDTFNWNIDKRFGVGDDGIYNITEPSVKASSELKENQNVFSSENIHDFNLTTPWIEGKPGYGVGEYIDFTFDLRSSFVKDSAFSINSFFVINGYRKTLDIWRANSRVKKLKMYFNNVLFAYILLEDTYKYQNVDFSDNWVKYGEKKIIRFEIVEVYPGDKYKDTAISELEFAGLYSENMH